VVVYDANADGSYCLVGFIYKCWYFGKSIQQHLVFSSILGEYSDTGLGAQTRCGWPLVIVQ
jgi:hypothetical protein